MKTKKPWLAFRCSLLLPGAGLAYLGMWRWAVWNFAVVNVILLLIVAFARGQIIEHIHYFFLILAAGSAGLAHAKAERAGQHSHHHRSSSELAGRNQ